VYIISGLGSKAKGQGEWDRVLEGDESRGKRDEREKAEFSFAGWMV
jgi:hypothetical protein